MIITEKLNGKIQFHNTKEGVIFEIYLDRSQHVA